MKGITAIIGLTVLLLHACHPGVRALHSQGDNIIIEGIVEKIGDAPGVGSGDHAVYQFAKYRVTSVCEGEYNQKEIVIDHLILEGTELERLHVGDGVRLTIKKSKTIFNRRNEDGFRNPDDKIEIFYTAGKPALVPPNCGRCEPCK